MPTDWEDHYRAGNLPWDKGGPSPGLTEFLEEEKIAGRVLVPGCGLGHDVRALARSGADVVGADIAPSAVTAARAAAGSSSGCHFELADFFSLPPSLCGVFDWVWEHTCFCAIDPAMRPRYVESARRALRGGGSFLGVFYLDPGQALKSDGPPFETTLGELDRLFSAQFTLRSEWAPARTYEGRRKREWMRLYRAI